MPSRSSIAKPFYDAHVFCCINERAPEHPRGSCALRGSANLHQYMKSRAKELGIDGIRVNKAGCLDRCELGPVVVIYPEGIWYGINSTDDVEQILQRHILKGERVEHLILANDQEIPDPATNGELSLLVSRIENLTPSINLYELRAPAGGNLPPFSAGAHIDVIISDVMRRSYSLTNSPSERHRYIIAVLDEPDGRGGSHWMHENLSEGDTITVMAPENNFALTADANQHIFVAGGIGIAPILAMGRHLTENGTRCMLHYCTKSVEQTAFRTDVTETFGDNVIFYHDGGDPSKGVNLPATLGSRPDGAHLYICGPKGLIDAALAASAHWPDGTVHYELFAGAEDALQANDGSFTVILKRSNLTLMVPPTKTILEVVREAGVLAESSCESGICGTCQTDLLAGTAEHRDEFLSPAEQDSQSTIMICMSRAKPGETLTLDL